MSHLSYAPEKFRPSSENLEPSSPSHLDEAILDLVRFWFDGGRQWHMATSSLKERGTPIGVENFDVMIDRAFHAIGHYAARTLYIRKPGSVGIGLDEGLILHAVKFWLSGDVNGLTVILKAFNIPKTVRVRINETITMTSLPDRV